MILQKDLIAESGLTRSTAETVLKRLRKRGEIEAVKDSYNHNRISYSDEDADKIRAEFAKVVERMNRHQESSPESREKEESKGKGFETPGSSPDKTVQDFVKEPGPEVNIGGPKRTETKGEKGPKKRVPLYKNPIVYASPCRVDLGVPARKETKRAKDEPGKRADDQGARGEPADGEIEGVISGQPV